MLIPGDRWTVEIVRDIGNSIHPSIQLEVDYPSNYVDGKMSLLDLKVWVQEGDGSSRIVHEFVTGAHQVGIGSRFPMKKSAMSRTPVSNF